MAMVVAETWETMKHAIEAYTGLSPPTFFTVIAVAAALYYAVSGFLASPPPPRRSRDLMEPPPPPALVGDISEEELRAYDGSDPNKPLLMAIKGQIYDVSQSRAFYGPGGPYESFAGRDASRALAKMSFSPEDLTGDISGLGSFELDQLQDWEYKFMGKYAKVGTVKKTVAVKNESSSSGNQANPGAIEGDGSANPHANSDNAMQSDEESAAGQHDEAQTVNI